MRKKMRNIFAISPNEPNLRLHTTHAKQALLLGIDAQGCIRILRNQEAKSVVGSLHSVISTKRKEGRKTILMKRVHETAGYRSSGQYDERIPCFHAESGQHFMLYAARSATQDRDDKAPSSVGATRRTRKARQKLTLEQEQVLLQRIGAAQSSGVDIFLIIEEVECWAKLSVASIYRKINQKRFPPPIKRDKSSLWSLSSLLAYHHGTWKPGAA
jgi:predicted DNA-binding transcriptional regulator AlpA